MKANVPASADKTNQSSTVEPQWTSSVDASFEDARSDAAAQQKLQFTMGSSQQGKKMQVAQAAMDNSARVRAQKQTAAMMAAKPVQRLGQSAVPNNTGLPDNLKSGIENLSGMSMDHVKVHYNSSQPAQLNAHAFAQGSDIHVAPGQEKHLPHEAWHVVQQAQGRVKPTMQMKAGVPVNDDAGLEHEADVMGAKADQAGQQLIQAKAKKSTNQDSASTQIVQAKLDVGGATDSGQALEALVTNLEHMHKNALSLGAEAAGEAKVGEFATKLAALKKVAGGDDPTAQAAVLDALQKEMAQAGVPLGTLVNAKAEEPAAQRFARDVTVQRLTGLEIGAIVGSFVGIGVLTYGIYRLCFGRGAGGPAVVPVGYGLNPIPIAVAGNLLQIAELECGSAPVVAFTGISSCLGIFRRNGANISAVHLPVIDSGGNLVTTASILNLRAAAHTALGGVGGTYYLVGEGEVWQGSGAGLHFAAIDTTFGGAHSSFGSGNYTASIDGLTNETVITRDGHEVLRGT